MKISIKGVLYNFMLILIGMAIVSANIGGAQLLVKPLLSDSLRYSNPSGVVDLQHVDRSVAMQFAFDNDVGSYSLGKMTDKGHYNSENQKVVQTGKVSTESGTTSALINITADQIPPLVSVKNESNNLTALNLTDEELIYL